MLDNLIESKNHREENTKRGGFLLGTFFLVATILLSGVLWSLFAKDITIGDDSLELSAMIAPVPEPVKPPDPVRPREREAQPQASENRIASRQINMARIDEVQPVPTEISVAPNTNKPRPPGPFEINANAPDVDFGSSPTGRSLNGSENTGTGLEPNAKSQPEVIEKAALPPPPVIKKALEEAPRKSTSPISGGVVNGKAKFLPKPIYSSAAIAVNAKGDVSVQVTIDEEGNVISAKAVDGHPLLKDSAERAARNAKFSPTLLSKQPVKVTGIIFYKFSRN
ncbi:MAG: TonB family C-terminal domain protein [Acidobacteria bacterium]|nr:TonB family C-terminal domain protein [Acidobacteriota bacterium]